MAVPIDKGLQEDEIADLLQKADAAMVFFSESCKQSFCRRKGMGSISLEEVVKVCGSTDKAGKCGGCKTEAMSGDVDKICCIFFTSGTSGGAKSAPLCGNFSQASLENGEKTRKG